MPNPSKCLTLGSPDVHPNERPSRGECDLPMERRLSTNAVRLIENLIVGVVTVVSAGVIVVTLLVQHDGTAPLKAPHRSTIEAGMLRR